MRSVVILAGYSWPNALPTFLHTIPLVAHELVKAHLVGTKALSIVLLPTHLHTSCSTTTNWLHNFPIEYEVHVVPHVDRSV